jgi:hypothetical protein
METPFLAWNVAREVSDSLRSQSELDQNFKKFLDDNKDAFMLINMLFPSLPQDSAANISLPLRRIAEQGLENQQKFAQGRTVGTGTGQAKDIDFSKGAMDAIQYALGPVGAIRTFSEVAGSVGDLGRSGADLISGAVLPPQTDPQDVLPVR